MTTIDRLDSWKEAGVITDAQHATLSEIVRRDRFSLFVELNALLYIGVVSVVAGLGWTFRDYVTSLGDAAILSILGLLMAVSFGYCFVRGPSYSNDEVESPYFAFDYILYFACLVLAATLAFIETRFELFHGWDTHLLIAALVFGVLAYRFDNRFVLSLALSTLAGYLGLKLGFDTLDIDVYLQLGANAVLLATVSGVFDDDTGWGYLAVLLILSALSIYLGIRFRKFAFVAYGTLFGYAGLSIKVLDAAGDAIFAMVYFVITGSIVVFALVVVARTFGRDE